MDARRYLLIFVFSILQIIPFAVVYPLVELLPPGDQQELWPLLCLVAVAVGELIVLALFHCPCRREESEELLRTNKRALYNYRVRLLAGPDGQWVFFSFFLHSNYLRLSGHKK